MTATPGGTAPPTRPEPTSFHVRQAAPSDAATVVAILHEAAAWQRERGMTLWLDDELLPDDIAREVGEGLFFLVERKGEAAGTFRFQLEDPEYWPDEPAGESGFVHRVAVRRGFAGQGVPAAMVGWAADHARTLGRRWLRLDCVATRPRLRALYEGLGFHFHSEVHVGPFHVARYQMPLSDAPAGP